MQDLHIPDGINYDCTGCGKCCSGWTVPMTEPDWERISEVDWGELSPSYKGKTLFRQLSDYESANTPYSHKIVSETGTCPFLVDNLCFIHKERGAEFKPAMCKLFPYSFCETPSGTYATVSFVSMAVIYNSGTPLNQQRDWIEKKWGEFRQLYPDFHPDWSNLKLAVERPISWEEYLGHEAVLLDILERRKLTISQRLLSGSAYLSAALKAKSGAAPPSTGNGAAGQPSQLADKYIVENVSEGVTPLKGLDRHLLSEFHKMYFPAKPHRRGDADFSILRLVNGMILTRPRITLPGHAYEIAALQPVPWLDGDEQVEDLLYRYFFSHIFGKKYFGGGFAQVSILAGFHHLILMYVLLKLHSKASALQRNAPVVSLIDVQAAVKQLERQVGETKLGGYTAAGFELLLSSAGRARRLIANT